MLKAGMGAGLGCARRPGVTNTLQDLLDPVREIVEG